MPDTTKNPLHELVDDTKNAVNDILGYLGWPRRRSRRR